MYTYQDIPAAAFPYGTVLCSENGYSFIIASAEKAICDCIYTCSPCSNRLELRHLLFEDLRLDESAFLSTNLTDMAELACLYRTANHRLLQSLIHEIKRHEQHH